MKLHTLICTLFLLLLAAPLAADEVATASPSGCQPVEIAATVVDGLAGNDLQVAAGLDPEDGPNSRAYCSATCEYGSASTNCSGTCTAVDQDCDSNVRGHVTCNGQVVDRCGTCPPTGCSAETYCPDGTYLSCSGSVCDGGGGLCYVRCDGVFQFCPGHEGQILCEL